MPSTLLYPVKTIRITQIFGVNRAFYAQFGLVGHNGVDFGTMSPTTPKGHVYVYPAADGIVSDVIDQDVYQNGTLIKPVGLGRYVRILHADGSQTVYGHNEKLYVKKGQHVTTQTIISLSGSTGISTGPHVHFGYRPPNWQKIYYNGFAGYVDPIKLFIKR